MTPSTAILALEGIVIELNEAELAQRYHSWPKETGLSTENMDVRLAEGKTSVSMKSVGIPMVTVGEFSVTGTCTLRNGTPRIQLGKVIPDAPWVWIIAPAMDDVMAGITLDVRVTEVKIAAGKMMIHGLKKSSRNLVALPIQGGNVL